MKSYKVIWDAIDIAVHDSLLPSMSFSLSKPKNSSFGDYSTNVALLIGNLLEESPMSIAEGLKNEFLEKYLSNVARVEVVKPGFINFFLCDSVLQDVVLDAFDNPDTFCGNVIVDSRTHIVEFSSPNIAKPFTIGHLRSTIIGNSIASILSHVGYKVVKDNHLGDWGTQFGKMIVAIKKWGDEEQISNSENPVKELVALYQKFHAESTAEMGVVDDTNPQLAEEGELEKGTSPLLDEAREWFVKLEKGDLEARRIWKICVDLSMREFSKIYERLGVSFDTFWGESMFEDKMDVVLQELKDKNLVRESKGALMVFFEDKTKLDPLMVLKKDGGTLYATRDLATDRYRKEFYGKDIVIINEVGKEQASYFKQIFKVEELLGYFEKGQRIHVKHGLYKFPDGKMSTRKGNVIWLADVLDEAVKGARALSGDNLSDSDIEKIGIGAIKFYDLYRDCEGDVLFSWENILNMEGDTGPYVQYTAVRINSLLEKARTQEMVPYEIVLGKSEQDIARIIEGFPVMIMKAASEYAPHHLASYLIDLARAYNSYYANTKIIQERNQAGLFVSKATANVLTLGLKLLGIEVPSKM